MSCTPFSLTDGTLATLTKSLANMRRIRHMQLHPPNKTLITYITWLICISLLSSPSVVFEPPSVRVARVSASCARGCMQYSSPHQITSARGIYICRSPPLCRCVAPDTEPGVLSRARVVLCNVASELRTLRSPPRWSFFFRQSPSLSSSPLCCWHWA